ncbi:MAG: hypothetical protein WDO72_05210 [Pseudomonadota bacterium]
MALPLEVGDSSLPGVVRPPRLAEHGGHKDLQENDVKRPNELAHSIPLHDYRPALRGAVSWLGDRYLLAEPVRRRGNAWQPARSAVARRVQPGSGRG